MVEDYLKKIKTSSQVETAKKMAISALEDSVSLSSLDETNILKKALNKIDIKVKPKEDLNHHFEHLIPFIKKTLNCDEVDEHVLFLASLSFLEDCGFGVDYKKILNEILFKNLHKSEVKNNNIELVGRKREVARILALLEKPERNSVIIVGNPGIGKTTLAEYIAQNLKNRKSYRIFPNQNRISEIVSGFLSNSSRPLFLLDELFSFKKEDIVYFAQNTQFLATANMSSYKNFEVQNPDIFSKVNLIMLDEVDKENSSEILESYLNKKTNSLNISIDNDFLSELISLSEKYLKESFFPEKGISLIEECLANLRLQNENNLSVNLLKTVVSQKSGIPIESLTDFEKKDLLTLPEKLSSKVKGQNEAVKKVSAVIQRAKLGFSKGNKPIGSFLFVGPSGVGKTELAKALAFEIFGDREAMVRLDMSEYAEAHTVQRLIGAPPGYIGFEEGGQLTNPVKEKPYNLVLLDEIEKAHPRIFDIFLQVLDDGRLTDGQGKVVDFKNTIIIATSNAGIEDILDMIEENKTSEQIEKELKEVLQDYFRVEFINRFDDIIIFNALKPDALREIAKLQIEKLKAQLKKQGIDISVSSKSLELLAQKSYDPRYGARGLIRFVQEQIENKLAQMLLEGGLTKGSRIEF